MQVFPATPYSTFESVSRASSFFCTVGLEDFDKLSPENQKAVIQIVSQMAHQ